MQSAAHYPLSPSLSLSLSLSLCVCVPPPPLSLSSGLWQVTANSTTDAAEATATTTTATTTIHPNHLSDLCRVMVLYRHGGVYLDLDVLFVADGLEAVLFSAVPPSAVELQRPV